MFTDAAKRTPLKEKPRNNLVENLEEENERFPLDKEEDFFSKRKRIKNGTNGVLSLLKSPSGAKSNNLIR